MKKYLKFQSEVTSKIDGVLQTYKSNELFIEVIKPKKRKTTVIDAPYIPCKPKCKPKPCKKKNECCKLLFLLWLLK